MRIYLVLNVFAAATPKQIRELMNVDGLTNDEVKSHLQVSIFINRSLLMKLTVLKTVPGFINFRLTMMMLVCIYVYT